MPSANAAWSGAPLTLTDIQSATLPQTPNGTLVFGASNLSPNGKAGLVALSSGGRAPVFLPVPFATALPATFIQNWRASNLTASNVSQAPNSPLLIQAAGPGLPGSAPLSLNIDGAPAEVAPSQCAQGTTVPRWMQLVFQASTPAPAVVALIGGPSDSTGNNAYLFALNASANAGPGTATPPPPGYYATTTSHAHAFQLNWGAATLFVANLSSTNSSSVAVLLRSL